MAKKQLTEEQRQELRERLAKARAAKAQKQEPNPQIEENVPVPPVPEDAPAAQKPQEEPKQTIADSNNSEQLMALMVEALSRLTQPQNAPQGAQATSSGLQGTVTKYSIDKYPDPREQLAQESALKRFAFEENFELNWEQNTIQYTTIDKVRMQEPKFTLELVRKVYDDEGNLTNGRYIVARLILHEDPDTALTLARNGGLDVPEELSQAFLNEMRYIRMKNWLLGCFVPVPIKDTRNKKDVVVDGKLVQFYEVSGESAQTIPFNELTKKG